jgi:hypothetical protein
MRLMGFLGLIALAGSTVPGLTVQHEASAAVATTACTGPFTQVPSPSPGSWANILKAAAPAGTHGLWAVGEQDSSAGAERQNLILFDGGHGWTQVTSPDPGPEQSILTAVSASGPADAWAVGYYFTRGSATTFAPQALHWDGSSWTQVPFPALHHEIDTEGISVADISPDQRADQHQPDAGMAGGGRRRGVCRRRMERLGLARRADPGAEHAGHPVRR